MQKKRYLLIRFFLFAALALASFFIFSDTRNLFISKQITAIETPPAENMVIETPAVVENDIEEITLNEEADSKEPADESVGEDLAVENSPLSLPPHIPVARKSNELTIGFITDLHVKTHTQNNGTSVIHKTFADRINYFVEKMNNEIVPDFIIINGDVIEGTKTPANKGMEQLRLVKNLFNRSAIQKYWVLGNHDLRSVTKQQWQSSLGINYLKKSFELRDYKIIILDSNFDSEDKNVAPGNGYTRGNVSKKEIEWLKNELKNTNKKTLVFIHHPPFWNVNFRSNDVLIENANKLRSIFSEYGVLAVFGGHVEELYDEKVDGVNYFALPGIYKNPRYPGAFAIINIKDDKVKVELNYLKSESAYTTINMKK